MRLTDKKVGSETGMTKKYESFTDCLSFLKLARVSRIVLPHRYYKTMLLRGVSVPEFSRLMA
jgi:hypothetical protein